MRLANIPLKHLSRKRGRTLFLVLGVTIGIAVIVGLFSIITAMQQNMVGQLDRFGANIIVVPKTSALGLSYGGFGAGGLTLGASELDESIMEKIYLIPDAMSIAVASEKLFAAVPSEKGDLVIAGLNFTKEVELKNYWRFEGALPEKSEEIMVGSEVEKVLGAGIGETLVLANKTYTVTAILNETGSQDDNLIFMNLYEAQEISGKKGKISMVDVKGFCNSCPLPKMAAQINEIGGVKATPVKQIADAQAGILTTMSGFATAIGAFVLLIGVLAVMNAMLSSVNERTKEIGTMRALGFTRSQIVSLIVMEGAVVGLIGGLVGYAAGFAAAKVLGPIVAGTQIAFEANVVVGAVVVSTLVGIIASVYPAWKASNLMPSVALRAI
ncbi:MAG: ABC transporter permease [Candidatus Micrarchaeota archaeon]